MLLGDLLTRVDDDALAAEMILSLRDRALSARVADAAAAEELTPGEFAVRSVDHFITRASDADWSAVIGQAERAPDPGEVFLRRVLADALTADGG